MTAKNGTATVEPTAQEIARRDMLEEWAELGPGFEIAISREPGGQYLEILPREEAMNIELIRERYGGGKFSLRLRENGQFVKGQGVQKLNVAGVPKVFPPVADSGASPAAAQTAEVALLRTEITRLGAAAQDGGATGIMLTGMMGMMTTVIEASLNRKDTGPSAIELFTLMRQLAKDERKANPPPSETMDIINTLGIPLLAEVKRLAPDKPGTTADTPPGAQLVEPGTTPKQPESVQELADFLTGWCEPHRLRGADPQLRAEVLMEDLAIHNPQLASALVGLATTPNVLDQWAKLSPPVADSLEWYGAFIAQVEDIANDPGEDAETGGSGDDDDGAGNAEAGEAGADG